MTRRRLRPTALVVLVTAASAASVTQNVGASSACFDFVAGGGWFTPRSWGESDKTGKVEFGFTAGLKKNQTTPNGDFNVVDRSDNIDIRGLSVDKYEPYGGDADHCRIFWGNAEMSTVPGVPLRYSVGICDYGRRGRNDRIRVTVCVPLSDCDTSGAGSNAGGRLGTLYFADNFDGTKTCPADAPFCGDLDSGALRLRKRTCTTSG